MIVLAYAIAILLPLFFLYLIYAQDLYGQGKFGHVLLAFGWGAVGAFSGAYFLNRYLGLQVLPRLGTILRRETGMFTMAEISLIVIVFIAPIVEEVLKSLILVYLGRKMTYFVDGAIYGFASGIGFSILENFFYLQQMPEGGAGLAFIRAISTCLMHGAASALVGTAVGRMRYGRGASRVLSMLLGWLLAIGLHMGFNRLAAYAEPGLGTLLGALGIGMGGAILIVVFIRWGLVEEKRWIAETLGGGAAVAGVSKGEVIRIQQYEQVDELLEPIVERFGQEKADLVEKFLLKQAHLGIKRKARSMSQGPREQETLAGEIAQLQAEMEEIRNQVGVYCMLYVRAIFPEDVLDFSLVLQQRLEERKDRVATMDLFQAAGSRSAGTTRPEKEPGDQPAGISLWGKLPGGDQETEKD
ncbi:MAG: PrsW family intramembrane metalloprotease [Chloroflexia bacterium]|nr:PrsW family intramembrane metalloprotease [Chloroflexia bacterium]